jgi:hypothetical protein
METVGLLQTRMLDYINSRDHTCTTHVRRQSDETTILTYLIVVIIGRNYVLAAHDCMSYV